MSVHRIEAVIHCDGCGCEFSVEMDAAYNPPKGWSLFDAAIDAIRGGLRGTIGPRGTPSIQGGYHLCPACTRTVDAIETAGDRNATADEVRKALKSSAAIRQTKLAGEPPASRKS